MKIFKILLLAFLYTSLDAASLCPKNKDAISVAKDLAIIEMSGIRLISGAKDNCLQSQFKEYRFNKDPDYDSPKNLEYIVNSKDDIKVEKVELINKDVFLYKAYYKVKVVNLKGVETVVKDNITFMLNTTKKSQKEGGCALVTEGIEKQLLLKSCKK